MHSGQINRELDTRVAREIFGYQVFEQEGVLQESAPEGDRPLRPYSTDMQVAWLVAEKMRISIMPVEGGSWFAFVGPETGWPTPEAFLEYLRAGDFSECGAAVGDQAPEVICRAALVANQKQKALHPSHEPQLTLVRDNENIH